MGIKGSSKKICLMSLHLFFLHLRLVYINGLEDIHIIVGLLLLAGYSWRGVEWRFKANSGTKTYFPFSENLNVKCTAFLAFHFLFRLVWISQSQAT